MIIINHNKSVLNLILHWKIIAGMSIRIYSIDWLKHKRSVPKSLKMDEDVDDDDDGIYLTAACWTVDDQRKAIKIWAELCRHTI